MLAFKMCNLEKLRKGNLARAAQAPSEYEFESMWEGGGFGFGSPRQLNHTNVVYVYIIRDEGNQ